MLCNVKCAARKIRITFCGRILCKSVKLTEPPDAEPHVRWCERSAAEAASYSIDGESVMTAEYRPVEYGKDYDVVNNPDKFQLYIDGKEIK